MAEWDPLRSSADPSFDDQAPALTIAWGRKLLSFLAILTVGSMLGVALARLPLLMVVGALLGLGSVVIILFKPFWGLMVYTILFTLRLGEIYPLLGHLHLERFVGVLTLASLLLDRWRTSGTILLDSSKQTRRLLLFVGAVALSVPMAFWREQAIGGLVEFFKILVFYVMIVHLVDSRPRVRHFAFLLCLTTMWLCGNSLLSYFTGNAAFRQGIDRATGTTSAAGNYNSLGTTAAATLPLMYLLTAHKSTHSFKKGILVLGMIAALITLVVTGSRASLLGFLGGLGYFWWKSRHRIIFGVMGLVFLVAAFAVIPHQYQQRYETITSGHLDESSASRVITWITGVRLFFEHPVVGVGIECFGSANGSSTGSFLNSHSLYVQVLAELGIIGTWAFVLLFTEMFLLNQRTRRRIAEEDGAAVEIAVLEAVFAGFMVLLVSGIFGHSLLRRTWYVYAAVNLAILRTWLQSRPVSSDESVSDLPSPLPDRSRVERMPSLGTDPAG